MKKKKIKLSKPEIQSGVDRVKHAEGLILQLQENHDGRNTWLLNYGVGEEARCLREKRDIFFSKKTKSAKYKKRNKIKKSKSILKEIL